MQVIRLTKKPKNLTQGSIVKLAKLFFDVGSRKKTLADFYPEITFDKAEYCIVLNQSCDLVKTGARKPKITHVLLCLLEPIKPYIENINTKSGVLEILSDGTSAEIVNKEVYYQKIWSEIKTLVDNNDSSLFFLELSVRGREKLLIANLCKIFPVKIEHYEKLLNNATYKLKPEFANKMAWKLASFFGRIGTRDYDDAAKQRIAKRVISLFQAPEDLIYLDEADFNKVSSNKGKPEKQAAILKDILERLKKE